MEHNEEQQGPHMKDKILEKIRGNEIAMRSKAYFTIKIAALAVVVFLVLTVSVFIFNFILFSLRINSQDVFLGFGPRGILAFFYFFPWSLLTLDIALIVVLEWLLRQFRFGYKIPVLYLLTGVLVVTAFTAVVIDRGTAFNERLLVISDEHRLPTPFGDFYGRARHPMQPRDGVCRCVITAINGNTLTVKETNGTTTLTVVLPMDDLHATTSMLQVGDLVLIAGDKDDDAIRAFGVRRINGEEHAEYFFKFMHP